MERKLVKQGRNALTITLPAAWLKEKGLGAGDVIDIEEGNNNLIIRTQKMQRSQEIEIDAKEADRSMVWHHLVGAYLDGYDRITVHHTLTKFHDQFSHEFIGMVIEEQSATKIVLGSVVKVPEQSFSTLLRRVLHLLVYFAECLGDLEAMSKQENVLDSLIYYCMRYLNKYENIKHAYKYFLLLSTIEAAADQLLEVAKVNRDKELNKVLINHTKLYAHYVAKQDFKELYASLRRFRNGINKRTYAQGLAFLYAETLYNNIGFLLSKE